MSGLAAGKRTNKVSFYSSQKVSTATGDKRQSQLIKTTWCEVVWNGGADGTAETKEINQVRITVNCLYSESLLSAKALQWKGQKYEITSIDPTQKLQNKLVIQATSNGN
jgi:hypothetical protein